MLVKTHIRIWKGGRPRYRFGGRVNVFGSGNVDSETMPTNAITCQAISEGVMLQGVKDPRGTTGIHAWRKPGLDYVNSIITIGLTSASSGTGTLPDRATGATDRMACPNCPRKSGYTLLGRTAFPGFL
jgi:hypothetical protein